MTHPTSSPVLAALPVQRTTPGSDVPVWPALGDPDLPAPEGARRRNGVRALALGTLAVTVAYLVWRLGWTLEGATLALAVPLLLLEAHATMSLALHTHDLWDVDAGPARSRQGAGPAPAGAGRAPRIAVLVPTYNEPREVLLPTIAAAVALEPSHETWVLDDGDRGWVAELCRDLGAVYRTRPTHEHAKAGNINAVLPELESSGVELVAVLDADHVAAAGFLTDTVGYFADPQVALVQTPQDFYNLDSFEHADRRAGRRFSEQELFYRGLAAGRNAWNAAFWCGTNAVLRLSALRAVGGIATESVTEDIHTTIRMHRQAWKSVYHNGVLARGLAAGDAAQYLGQRLRWGTGAMQVLRRENPLRVSGLTLHQRVSYASTLLGWFESWRSLGYVLLPLATVAAGSLPIAAPAAVFLPVFAAVFVLQRFALVTLGRGRAPWWHSTLFEFVRMPANLQATFALLHPDRATFTVTAKGRSGSGRERVRVPRLLVVLLVASVVALGWYGATLAGLTGVSYPLPWVAHGAAAWAVVNGALLFAAVRRIRSDRYAGERRASVRFALEGPVRLGSRPGRLEDVSLTGLRAVLPADAAPAAGLELEVTLPTSAGTLVLPGVVRSRTDDAEGRAHLGVEFAGAGASAQASLALALFRTGITPRLVESTPAV